MYLERKYQLETLVLRLLLETGPPFTWSSEPPDGLAARIAKGVPSFLSQFKTLSVGPVSGIEPATTATSRSAVKRSTDGANPAAVIKCLIKKCF